MSRHDSLASVWANLGVLLLCFASSSKAEEKMPMRVTSCCDPSLRFIGDEYVPFSANGVIGFKDPKGMVVIQPRFEETLGFQEGYAPVQIGGKWGMIDHLGTLAVEAELAQLNRFSEGLAVARSRKGGKLSYLGRGGGPRLPENWAAASDFSEGLAAATTDGRAWGYINFRGEWVIKPEFDSAGPFCEGLAPVERRGLFGFVDRNGRIVIKARFDAAAPFSAGQALVTEMGRSVMIDRRGNVLSDGPDDLERAAHGRQVPPQCRWFPSPARPSTFPYVIDDSHPYSEGAQALKSNGKWGIIDFHGTLLIPFEYAFLGTVNEGLVPYRKDNGGLFGFLDRKGIVRIEARYANIAPFHNGQATFQERLKWGVIDHEGRHIVTPQYDAIGLFTEGIATVRVGNKWGHIYADGSQITGVRYDEARPFIAGRAAVAIKTQSGALQYAEVDKFERFLTQFKPATF